MNVLSKAYLYSPVDQIVSDNSTNFNHPARLDIIRFLNANGPQNVHEIASHHPLSLSGVSQHIEFLRTNQILKFEKQTPFLLYSVDFEVFDHVRQSIINYLVAI